MNKILLVQFREDISAVNEKKCFLHCFKKKKNLKLQTINAFDKKYDFSSPQKIIKKKSGVILGGSGEFYLSGNKEQKKEKIFQAMVKRIAPFVKYLLQNDFPTLGICFGHQLLGYFLGEKVVFDRDQAETGSFLVFLTKEGKNSPLFAGLPWQFYAQFGHQDSLKKLPKGTKLLATTQKCKVAAFQYKSNIYGVQFHPELDYKDMLFRLKLYPEYAENINKIKNVLKPTPFSSKIIQNFLKNYAD